jgi:hypothetical protein
MLITGGGNVNDTVPLEWWVAGRLL